MNTRFPGSKLLKALQIGPASKSYNYLEKMHKKYGGEVAGVIQTSYLDEFLSQEKINELSFDWSDSLTSVLDLLDDIAQGSPTPSCYWHHDGEQVVLFLGADDNDLLKCLKSAEEQYQKDLEEEA